MKEKSSGTDFQQDRRNWDHRHEDENANDFGGRCNFNNIASCNISAIRDALRAWVCSPSWETAGRRRRGHIMKSIFCGFAAVLAGPALFGVATSANAGTVADAYWQSGICAGISSVCNGQLGFPARSGTGISFAIFRRFWAVAARRNSSRAPFGPRSRSRPSLRKRLRCANSISTFFRSRRAMRPCDDLAIWRAISRAPS